MSRVIAWLAHDETLLCVDGSVTRTFMDFDPIVEGVPLGSFVSCAGLYGTTHLAPRDVVVVGNRDRRRFERALPAFRQRAPAAAAALTAALAALPPTTDDKTVKR